MSRFLAQSIIARLVLTCDYDRLVIDDQHILKLEIDSSRYQKARELIGNDQFLIQPFLYLLERRNPLEEGLSLASNHVDLAQNFTK